MSQGGIDCRSIARRFGTVTALAGVDLSVDRGEVVALLGQNGAGKSTLLRILATIVTPDAGVATVEGIDVTEDPASVRRRIGIMLGDERSLYWRLSGRANLRFYAALHGIRNREAGPIASRLLERVGLAEAGDRPVRTYSSGMRVRLSLARSLIGDPPALLFDEPTRSLDPIAANSFRELAKELAGEGRSILLATHDLGEAVAVADRVVALDRGRIALATAAVDYDVEGLGEALIGAVGAETR